MFPDIETKWNHDQQWGCDGFPKQWKLFMTIYPEWPNGLGSRGCNGSKMAYLGVTFSQMPWDLAKLRLKWIDVSDWQSPILSLLLSSPMVCCRLEIRLDRGMNMQILQAISTGILGMVTHMITWLRFCLHHHLQRLILSPTQAVATSLPNKTIFGLCWLGLLTP